MCVSDAAVEREIMVKRHASEIAVAQREYNMLFNTAKAFLNTLVETEAGPMDWPEYQALLTILYPDTVDDF